MMINESRLHEENGKGSSPHHSHLIKETHQMVELIYKLFVSPIALNTNNDLKQQIKAKRLIKALKVKVKK